MALERFIRGELLCKGTGGGPGHALPGDRPQWPRDRAFAIHHSKIDVRLDVERRSVSGTVTHTVSPFNNNLRAVAFDAVEQTIESVSVGGKPASFTYDGLRLMVELETPRNRGDEFRIAIAYSAAPRLGLYFTGPDEGYPGKPVQAWTQGQDEDSKYWFPCYDAPNQKQTTDLLATVPGDWVVLSNGRLLENKLFKDGTRRFHWHQDRPHSTYLVTLVAGKFERIEASRDGGLAIDYYVEAADVEKVERTFGQTPAMIDLFEEVTGVAYPWAKYSQVVVRDFVFGGMENTSATTMTENILLDAKAARDTTSDGLVSHELAHMWWGDLLTCRDWSHGWLNEGFATYMECLWTERHLGVDEYRQEVLTNTELYLGEEYRRPIVSNVFHQPIDVFDRHLYEKGSLVLHMLRQELGDDLFFRSLRRYCGDNQDRNVTTDDLVRAIAEETGRHLDWFFDQWLYRPGHPKLKVTWRWDDGANTATVAVKQTQDRVDGTPLFRLPVAIDFRKGRGAPQRFRVVIEQEEQSFAFRLNQKPDLCRFDPYGGVLKEVEFDRPVGELAFQLANDDDIGGRRAAATALGKKGGPQAIAALEQALAGDRFWGVAAAAAEALGATRAATARDALLRHVGTRHPKTRRAVVAALGQFHGDRAVLEALMPLGRRDASWWVESEANRSIGKLRLPGSFEVISGNIDRPSFRALVRIGCIDGLVELRDERGLDLLARVAIYGQPFQARPPALRAMARLAKRFESRKAATGDLLIDYLHDPDFRVRIAAADGLKQLGDGRHAAALDTMAERELDGRAVRVAREAAASLRKGDSVPDDLKKLRDEVEELRQENRRLAERLEQTAAALPGRAKANE
jgi:aminopeptidase N